MPQGVGSFTIGVKKENFLQFVKNILTKCFNTNNPHNVVKATIEGLTALRSAKECASLRGK